MSEHTMAEVLDSLQNDRVRYATALPEGSPFVSAGREIKITAPTDLLQAFQPGIERMVPALIRLFDSPDQDWAANVLLYALTGRDAMLLGGFEANIGKWRDLQKESDRRYWTGWWEKNRGKLAWSGRQLRPVAQ
jgi:hypothetical protein